jgi:thymidine phosphorylase
LEKYPKTKYKEVIKSNTSGFMNILDNTLIGMASLELGAGRKTKEDFIDPAAGIIFYPKIGTKVKKNDIIAELYTNKKDSMELAKSMLVSSYEISRTKIKPIKLIKTIIK